MSSHFLNSLFTVCMLTSLLSKRGNGAIAEFANNGIDGSVTVIDGFLEIEIDFDELDTSLIGGSDCFADGFSYHIHETWDHSDDDDKVGSTDCGSTYTGGHWDPWVACGSASGNIYCISKDPVDGCVTGSSAAVLSDDGDDSDDAGYDCDSDSFTINPYVCEVGDWSGKYGKVTVDNDTNLLLAINSNAFEVDGSDLSGKSIVFHCSNDGSRAFCAPFVNTDVEDTDVTYRPSQSGGSKIGKFNTLDDTSMIILEDSGEYEISFDISSISLPDDCGDNLLYRIYNDWTDMNSISSVGSSQCIIKGIGMFYDPTVTCGQDTDATDFCENGLLCEDDSFVYNCDFTNDRYSCAPGDLSGKYGMFAVDTGATSFYTSGIDELMIDLSLIEGKSVVLQCSDTYEVVACAQFRDYDEHIPACPDSCDEKPCSCGEATNCNVCHDGQGCSQCENGCFRRNVNMQCSDCETTFGEHCMHCSNQNGCQQCAQGYFLVYDTKCELYYCL